MFYFFLVTCDNDTEIYCQDANSLAEARRIIDMIDSPDELVFIGKDVDELRGKLFIEDKYSEYKTEWKSEGFYNLS